MPSFYVTSKFYIKEIKGKYYVYSMEKDEGGKQRHYYVAPLERIIETYVNIGSGEEPPQCRGRDLNPGHRLERPAYCRRVELDRAILPRHLYTTP